MQRNGASVPRRRLTPAVRPLPISSDTVLRFDLFRVFSRLQNFVAGLLCLLYRLTTKRPPTAIPRDQSGRSPWPSSLSALFRQGLVVHDLVVMMMMHRMLHDVMMLGHMVTVMLDHMMMVMAMMLDHLLRRRGRRRRRIGTACGKYRSGECERYGEADRGQEFRLHGMCSLA
jgi:predicted lysophospholipase L1 biosynthesis ABC-type transport system permease subunit